MVLADFVYGVGWCGVHGFLYFPLFWKTNKTIYNTENVSNLALVEYMESA